MAEIGSAFLSIIPSARGFGRTLESDVSRETNGVGKKVGAGFGKAFGAAAGLLAAAGIGSFLKDSIGEAREAQKVGAATTQIIKATGMAANLTADQVGNLSGALSAKIGVDDEVIQSGANILLTFKAVRDEVGKGNDVFTRATAAGADLAAAGFGSIEANAKTLGKALNDPLKGITALTRSGVTFTEQQKEQIATLVESGDILKAQKIILGEVEAQVGGVAAATATSGEKFAVAYGNLKESIGTALFPLMDRLATAATTKVIPALEGIVKGFSYLFGGGEEGARGFAEIIDNAFGNTGKYIGPVTKVTEAFQTAFAAAVQIRTEIAQRLSPVFNALGGFISRNPELVRNFAIALGVLVGAIGAVTLATTAFSIALNTTGIPLLIIGVAALAAGLIYAYQHSEAFRTTVQSLATTVQTTVLPALQSMWAYFQSNVVPVLQAVGAVIRDQVLPIIGTFAQFVVGTLIPAIVRIATQIGSNLAPIFKQLVATFKADVLPTIQLVLAKFREYQPVIQQVISVVTKVIGKYLEFAAAVLGKVLPPLIRFAGFLISNVVPSVIATIDVGARIIKTAIAIGTAFVDAVKDVAKFVSGLKDKIGDAINAVKEFPNRAKGALGFIGSVLLQAGKDLIQGLINGIVDKAGDAVAAIGNAVSDMVNAAKNKLKIFSPSRVFHEIGEFTMKGLANGVDAEGPKAVKAVIETMTKMLDGLKTKRDQIKSALDGFKSDFASLRDSITSTFTGNLFEATNGQDFLQSLLGKQGDLKGLKAAFAKLRGYGVSPAFLSQLFASGNSALILDLAAGEKSQANLAASLFNDTNTLAGSLGNQVARADVGPKIDRTNAELAQMNRSIKQLAGDLADAINDAAVKGKKGRVAA